MKNRITLAAVALVFLFGAQVQAQVQSDITIDKITVTPQGMGTWRVEATGKATLGTNDIYGGS